MEDLAMSWEYLLLAQGKFIKFSDGVVVPSPGAGRFCSWGGARGVGSARIRAGITERDTKDQDSLDSYYQRRPLYIVVCICIRICISICCIPTMVLYYMLIVSIG